jgi:uncharacterized C2H2 Zn-finger protein
MQVETTAPTMSQLSVERRRATQFRRPTLEEWEQSLTTHPRLDRLGYVWHPGIKVLVCVLCKTAVSPGSVEAHCTSHDTQDTVGRKDKVAIEELLQGCQFGERDGRLPDLAVIPCLPPIQLFDTVNAFQCPSCVKLYDDESSAKRHFNKAHGSRVGKEFIKVPAQYLFRGHYSVMFPVTQESKATLTEDISQRIGLDLQAHMSKSLQDAYKADWSAKDAWPYLKDVPWHLVLEANIDKFTIAELKTLVSIPGLHLRGSRGSLATHIALAVERWVFGMEIEVRSSDYRLRRYIGSDQSE